MYKYVTGPEPDHNGYEWVEPDDQCEDCGHTNRECTCREGYKDEPDERTIRNQAVQKSFYQKYGFDERDGLPGEVEEEEERGYLDDPPLSPTNRIW